MAECLPSKCLVPELNPSTAKVIMIIIMVRLQLHSSLHPIFPKLIFKRLCFLHRAASAPFFEDHLTVCGGLLLDYCLPLVHMAIFMPVPSCSRCQNHLLLSLHLPLSYYLPPPVVFLISFSSCLLLQCINETNF
jgi:hypothetical protein